VNVRRPSSPLSTIKDFNKNGPENMKIHERKFDIH